MFGDNPYVEWMRARGDFESSYETFDLGAAGIKDAMLISTRTE
jgi:hypothetical protein